MSEDLRILFPLKIEKSAKPISSCSSKFQARQAKRIEVHKLVRKTGSALSYMYEDNIGFERVVVNSKIAASERSRVSAVQDRMMGYSEERSRKS